MDAATRERLGEMFCGWYFRGDEPARVSDFAAGDVPEDADPIRLRDVASEVMQERFATAGVRADGTSIWSRISAAVERFRGCGCVVLIVPVWNVDGRELLHDGTTAPAPSTSSTRRASNSTSSPWHARPSAAGRSGNPARLVRRQRMLRTSRPFSRWLCSRPSL